MSFKYIDFQRWINCPPVRVRKSGEFEQDAKRLWESVLAYHGSGQLKSSQSLTGTYMPIWHNNYESIKTLIEGGAHKESLELTPSTYCTYFLSGKPVGLLKFKRQAIHDPVSLDSCYISLLISHPAVSGCGGTLLEYAFHLSREMGWPQSFYLKSVPSAVEAYRRLGFKKPQTLEYLQLDPNDCGGVWKNVGGDWRLAACESKGYLSDVPV